jgi:excisionase family DNA binding protein
VQNLQDQASDNRRKPVAGVHPLESLIDSQAAAFLIGIHPKTLQRMARTGEIKSVHVGKLWRFRASAIEEWINQRLAS